MEDELLAAEEYIVRAEEVRQKVEQLTDPKIRATMLEIATDYEKMAAAMIRIRQSRTAIQRLANSSEH